MIWFDKIRGGSMAKKRKGKKKRFTSKQIRYLKWKGIC